MRKRKILLVEDVELFLMLERTFLRRDEFELITAHFGEDALAMIGETAPDLIFLDMFMPGMNGDECCRAIKGDRRFNHIPVVIVARGERDDDLKRCLDAGCDAVLLKPVNSRDLLETIRKCLRIENRVTPRYSARFPVKLGTAQQTHLSGYAVNLSTGGLFLETGRPLETGDMVSLEFLCPGSDAPTSCSAVVAWTNDPESLRKPDLPPGMGVRFLGMTTEEMELLRLHIHKGRLTPLHSSAANLPIVSERNREVSKVLVADDNAGSFNRLRAIFERESYAVLDAATCEEALARAVAEQPDLVVVNTAMQGREGQKLCLTLARHPDTADIPVLVLSGWTLSIGGAADTNLEQTISPGPSTKARSLPGRTIAFAFTPCPDHCSGPTGNFRRKSTKTRRAFRPPPLSSRACCPPLRRRGRPSISPGASCPASG